MRTFAVALLAGAVLALPAYAETKAIQPKPGDAAAQKTLTPQAQGAVPQREWKEAFDDWILACVQVANGQKSCAMSQTLSNAQTRQVIGVFSVGKDASGKLFANIQTPLGFAVSSGIQLVIDTQPGLAVPIRTCLSNGCLGVVELDSKAAADLQKASKLTVSMLSLDSKPITMAFSTKGFGNAYSRLMEEATSAEPAAKH